MDKYNMLAAIEVMEESLDDAYSNLEMLMKTKYETIEEQQEGARRALDQFNILANSIETISTLKENYMKNFEEEYS